MYLEFNSHLQQQNSFLLNTDTYQEGVGGGRGGGGKKKFVDCFSQKRTNSLSQCLGNFALGKITVYSIYAICLLYTCYMYYFSLLRGQQGSSYRGA